MIVKADKGRTCVILYTSDYTNKVQTFLNNNNFQKLPKDPTGKHQKSIIKVLQQCNLIGNKKQMKFLIQTKPQPPTLKAQIKIHKPDNPIRPIVNNINAPAYKISKYLVNKLNDHLNLKYYYNVRLHYTSQRPNKTENRRKP